MCACACACVCVCVCVCIPFDEQMVAVNVEFCKFKQIIMKHTMTVNVHNTSYHIPLSESTRNQT